MNTQECLAVCSIEFAHYRNTEKSSVKIWEATNVLDYTWCIKLKKSIRGY